MVLQERIDDRHVGAVSADNGQSVVCTLPQLNRQPAEMFPRLRHMNLGVDSGISQSCVELGDPAACQTPVSCGIDDNGKGHARSICNSSDELHTRLWGEGEHFCRLIYLVPSETTRVRARCRFLYLLCCEMQRLMLSNSSNLKQLETKSLRRIYPIERFEVFMKSSFL